MTNVLHFRCGHTLKDDHSRIDMERSLTVRVPDRLVVALEKEAARRGLKMSAVVRQAIERELMKGDVPEALRQAVLTVLTDSVERVAGKKLKKAG